MKTGLIVDVYGEVGEHVYLKHESYTLIDGEISGPFEPNEDRPEINLVRREIFGKPYIHAVPAALKDKQTMFGGKFIYTSDSRFRKICDYPVAIHDRVE
jgi:hypothetical protein